MRYVYLSMVYRLARCILAGRLVKPAAWPKTRLARLGIEEVRLTTELAHANEKRKEKAWRFLYRYCRPEEAENVNPARIIGWIKEGK